MSLILHAHPLSSYCWKVLIPLYENQTPFAFRQLDLGDPDSRAAFLSLWPIGKMPVLEDGPRRIVESSIIIEYLDLHHPGPIRFIPADAEAALDVRLLDRFFDQYVMAPMQRVIGDRLRPPGQKDALGVEQALGQLPVSYQWLEDRLSGEWVAGDEFSLADCAAAPSLYYADRLSPVAGYPKVAAYLERLRARASFARVLAEAEPWDHLFPRD